MATPALTAEWGKDSSKGDILCTYCGRGMRRDNLTRHTLTSHPGKKESWRLKPLEGQKSLTSFFSPKPPGTAMKVVTSTPVKDHGDKVDVSFESSVTYFDDEDMSKDISLEHSPRRKAPGQAVRIESPLSDGHQTYLSSTPQPTKKRHCSGPEGVLASVEMSASLDVSTIIENVQEEFFKEISKMLNDTKIAGSLKPK